ncbi:MAG: hemerythrin family protein [Candidatus Thorarchaeota archaeon]|nr:hemerythrin family protein [Candidatus Thorarchaeota archaeon]
MVDIKWDDSLSVNVELIDHQHKELIKRISDISEAVDTNQSPEVIVNTLLFMSEYADFHFSTEERHMKEQNYPAMEHHLKQHEEFKSMVQTMIMDFKEEGATPALGKSINTYLMNWLIDHIKGIDLKFGEFLHSSGFSE